MPFTLATTACSTKVTTESSESHTFSAAVNFTTSSTHHRRVCRPISHDVVTQAVCTLHIRYLTSSLYTCLRHRTIYRAYGAWMFQSCFLTGLGMCVCVVWLAWAGAQQKRGPDERGTRPSQVLIGHLRVVRCPDAACTDFFSIGSVLVVYRRGGYICRRRRPSGWLGSALHLRGVVMVHRYCIQPWARDAIMGEALVVIMACLSGP